VSVFSQGAHPDVSVGYRGVLTGSGDPVFNVNPIENMTINIGAFLAVCHALAFCAKRGLETPIYSDSQTALTWIRNRKCGSALTRTAANLKTFDLVDRAEKWLASHQWRNSVLQWNTRAWGPIPANLKRKMNHGS
jgi:ribonuclease HI